jgi:U3 small nucleolar RNA-associated protein 12
MGKSYLRYVPSASFGVIASVGSNAVYDQTGKLAYCPALERVNLWHLKQGTLVASYVGDAEVTAMARHDDILAVGYADGVVKIWRGGECAVTLQGHRGAVTVLKWDRRGSWLISGGKDTDVIVWDVVAETGLFR